MKKVVFVVDGPTSQLSGLSESLERAGYAVTRLSVDNAMAAFEDSTPEIVLIQLFAGGGQGVTVTEQVRQRPDGAIVPILFFGSGHEMVTSVSDALAVGGDYYFQHPLSVDQVLGKIRTYIGIGEESDEEDGDGQGHDEVTHPNANIPGFVAVGGDTSTPLEDMPDLFGDSTQVEPQSDMKHELEEIERREAAKLADAERTRAEEETRRKLIEAEEHKREALAQAELDRQARELLESQLKEQRERAEEEKRARAELEAKLKADAQAREEAEAKAQAERAKAEAAAKARQEEEAKKAEAEAKARAEKQVAEAQAKAREEADALRAQAEEQKRARVELEAKLKAEAQAREEAETKARAERAKAEAEAARPPKIDEGELRKRVETAVKARLAAMQKPAAPESTPETPPVTPPPSLAQTFSDVKPMRPEPAPVKPEVAQAQARAESAMTPLPPKAPEATSGELRESSILSVFSSFIRQEITGRVRFAQGNIAKTIGFEAGRPVEVVSNDPLDRVEEFLYREHLLTRTQYQTCRLRQLDNARQMAALVVSEGFLKPQELFSAVREHFASVLYGLFDWTSGSYEYSAEMVSVEERIVLPVTSERFIIEGVRRRFLLERMITQLGGPSSLLVSTNATGFSPDKFGLDSRERMLFRLIDGTRSIEDLVFTTGLSEQRVYQVLIALEALGYVQVAVRGLAASETSPQNNDIDRARIKEKYELAKKADYIDFLGLALNATEFEIERALASVRKAFAKERFAFEVSRELAQELKEIDRVLADAEYVLLDPRLREAYLQHTARSRAS